MKKMEEGGMRWNGMERGRGRGRLCGLAWPSLSSWLGVSRGDGRTRRGEEESGKGLRERGALPGEAEEIAKRTEKTENSGAKTTRRKEREDTHTHIYIAVEGPARCGGQKRKPAGPSETYTHTQHRQNRYIGRAFSSDRKKENTGVSRSPSPFLH